MATKYLSALTIALLLTNCGGGSDATSTPATPVSVPMQAAFQKITANGISGNFSLSGLEVAPFNGPQTPLSGTGTFTLGTMQSNGVSSESFIGTTNGTPYSNSDFIAFGSGVSTINSLPATVSAGQSGSFGTAATYVVTANTSDSLFITTTSSTGDPLLSTMSVSNITLKIDTAGNTTLTSIKVHETFEDFAYTDLALTF